MRYLYLGAFIDNSHVKWGYYVTKQGDEYDFYRFTLWENVYQMPSNPYHDMVWKDHAGNLKEDEQLIEQGYIVGDGITIKNRKLDRKMKELDYEIERYERRVAALNDQYATHEAEKMRVKALLTEMDKKSQEYKKSKLLYENHDYKAGVIKSELKQLGMGLTRMNNQKRSAARAAKDDDDVFELIEKVDTMDSPSKSPRVRSRLDELFQVRNKRQGQAIFIYRVFTIANHFKLPQMEGIERRHFTIASPIKKQTPSPRLVSKKVSAS